MLNHPLPVTLLYLSQHRIQIVHITLKPHPHLNINSNQTPKTNPRPPLRQPPKIHRHKATSLHLQINNIKITGIISLIEFQYP